MLTPFSFWRGRRQSFPSPDREKDAYVDLYPSRFAILVTVFFALTVFDAVATVYYIDHIHGTELNPIALWLLRRGRYVFFFTKAGSTALMLLFVLIHKNFRYGRTALWMGFSFYFLLAIYHLALQIAALILATTGRPVV